MTDKIKIRAIRPTDFNYIISSWLKTYKYSGPSMKRVRDRDYYETYNKVITRLIGQSDVYVASLREDEDVIVGYLAIERQEDKDVIHFILVKDAWQRIGIGKFLLLAAAPKDVTYFTHWTNPVNSLSNKYPEFIYNPFLIGA